MWYRSKLSKKLISHHEGELDFENLVIAFKAIEKCDFICTKMIINESNLEELLSQPNFKKWTKNKIWTANVIIDNNERDIILSPSDAYLE